MPDLVWLLVAGIIGYLWGAIPFGFIFVRLTKGIDLRDVGSGRTGGTNSMRAAGPVVGAITGLSDALKGACAIWLSRALFGNAVGDFLPWVEVAAGVMTIVGHNWSVFLKFKGGAGTGPNIGWATAIWWPMFPIGVVGVVGMLGLTGMASVASLTMAAIIPLVFGIQYFTGATATAAYFIGGLITAMTVTWSLRPNIQRLLDGSERMVGPAARRKQRKEEEM